MLPGRAGERAQLEPPSVAAARSRAGSARTCRSSRRRGTGRRPASWSSRREEVCAPSWRWSEPRGAWPGKLLRLGSYPLGSLQSAKFSTVKNFFSSFRSCATRRVELANHAAARLSRKARREPDYRRRSPEGGARRVMCCAARGRARAASRLRLRTICFETAKYEHLSSSLQRDARCAASNGDGSPGSRARLTHVSPLPYLLGCVQIYKTARTTEETGGATRRWPSERPQTPFRFIPYASRAGARLKRSSSWARCAASPHRLQRVPVGLVASKLVASRRAFRLA